MYASWCTHSKCPISCHTKTLSAMFFTFTMLLSTGYVLFQQRVFHIGLLGFRMPTYLTPTSCSLVFSFAVSWSFSLPSPSHYPGKQCHTPDSSVPQESRAPLITLYQKLFNEWILGATCVLGFESLPPGARREAHCLRKPMKFRNKKLRDLKFLSPNYKSS